LATAAPQTTRASRTLPKNWQTSIPIRSQTPEGPDDNHASYFGPDICYWSGALGLSSNCSYNPAQSANYMRNGIRDWSIWLKKQTGVDGFRLDAAKHFEPWATQDFLWNLAYNAVFASGSNHMYAAGEYVGSASEMDSWVDAVNASNGGGYDLVGSFDFSLRSALKTWSVRLVHSISVPSLRATESALAHRAVCEQP